MLSMNSCTIRRRKRAAAAAAMVLASGCLMLKKKTIKRRWWVRPWLINKNEGGLKLAKIDFKNDIEQFKRFLRMSETTFNKLLQLVEPYIKKENTYFREPISAKDKLIITLRFLATGESYRSLMYTFRVSESTISLFVPLVCRVIYDVLKEQYLKTPNMAAEWLNISKEFEDLWNIPNVVGALDGKHIAFRPLRSDGSVYFNYKGHHSIVLLAVVDAKYNFIYVDVGVNGRVSDGGVYKQSSLARAVHENTLNLPENKPLPGREKSVPHLFLSDAAFPLSKHILKPYPFRNMTEEQRIFNYRLSRGRRVVENAFGILANRFRIFLNTINLRDPEKVKNITLACCALHNFLKSENPNFLLNNDKENKYIFKHALSQQQGNRSKNASLNVREEFKDFFMKEGAVPWQYDAY